MTPAEHLVDGTGARTKREVLLRFAEALSFPDWFGGNLDALYDCLADLSWLPDEPQHVRWTHSAELKRHDPGAYAGIRSVLADAAEVNPRFTYTVS
ncbi:RNAse (barnase) inhibitor barstar [Crossiella equi]|uniref:RNAse (Barnase) inhibitor barstar n=1 Tax=Crossiella equi TaxID=130796 RepID=A0ABS5ABZ6_9PSEU|nr:barstar family protein [Crossiella equi]MBP2474113.1 RNAse (barnase) inhibitor barstar [Crossiella equi]